MHQVVICHFGNTIFAQDNSLPRGQEGTLHDIWALGVSPINIKAYLRHLHLYKLVNSEHAMFLREGLVNGFKIQYSGPRIGMFSKNLISAKTHANILEDKLKAEIIEGRIMGPFQRPPFPNTHVSPIGIIPKSNGGWRMITHLSYPPTQSINDFIDPELCTVRYTSFDDC